eukprot:15280279-Alexandrium_andersonii.AAC.1
MIEALRVLRCGPLGGRPSKGRSCPQAPIHSSLGASPYPRSSPRLSGTLSGALPGYPRLFGA